MSNTNFEERFKQLIEECGAEVTYYTFFKLALDEFTDEEDQRFLNWFKEAFHPGIRDRVSGDYMLVKFEQSYPNWLEANKFYSLNYI